MPRYSASRFAGIRWWSPPALPLHVGSEGDGLADDDDLATGGAAPSLSTTPAAKRTRFFSPFRRGRLSELEEEEERQGRRDAGEAGTSSSCSAGLAKRRSEKRTRDPESAMAVAAASAREAPIEDDEEDEDMVASAVGVVWRPGVGRQAGGRFLFFFLAP